MRRSKLENVTLIVASIAGLGSLLRTAYDFGYLDGQWALNSLYESTGKDLIFLSIDFPHQILVRQGYIAFGMVCCAIGLWLGGYFGRGVSAVSVAGVLGCYLWWRIETLDFPRITEATPYVRSHDPELLNMGFFRGATRWDFVLFAISAIIGAAHLLILAKYLKKTSASKRSVAKERAE